mgnify:CR=1 FL=1
MNRVEFEELEKNKKKGGLDRNKKREKENIRSDRKKKTKNTATSLKESSIVLMEGFSKDVFLNSCNICITIPFGKKLIKVKINTMDKKKK